VREFLHGPERTRSIERPEIRLQFEPVVAQIIEHVLREESRYGLLDGVTVCEKRAKARLSDNSA
jgi:hypothetical protein